LAGFGKIEHDSKLLGELDKLDGIIVPGGFGIGSGRD